MAPSPFIMTTFVLPFVIITMLTILGSSSEFTNLVYKGCAEQKFPEPTETYTQTLRSLFDTLVSQSSTAKFYKTTSGEGQSAIDGRFQCRGDLSHADCKKCVSMMPSKFQRLCGMALAARVHLNGCYMRYELSGFNPVSGTELLYKVCGSNQARGGPGFEYRLVAALGEIEKGVGNGDGFYTGGFESVYVLGQCEGDLDTGVCVNCVKSAVERAKNECVFTISGQIYLQDCYVSYAYYPNGVPRQSFSETGTGQNPQKMVAIVLGGIVGLGLGIAFLLVLKSMFKQRNRAKYHAGGGYTG